MATALEPDRDLSWIQLVKRAPAEVRARLVASLDPAELEAITSRWEFLRRPSQTPPDWAWQTWALVTGRGFGKALALDTPLPTVTGWTSMGDVAVGDRLIDERGHPCTVTFATAVQHQRDCWQVRFDDGSCIIADSDHRWLTWDRAARKSHSRGYCATQPAVRTTAEIAATLRVGSRHEANHSIDVCAPWQLPAAELPIDPYLLGYWLGDGSSRTGTISVGHDDLAAFAAAMDSRGIRHEIWPIN